MFHLFRRLYRDRSVNFLMYVSVNFAGLGLFFKAIAYTFVFDSLLTLPTFMPEISPVVFVGFLFAVVSAVCYQVSDAADSVLEDREESPHPEYRG